MALLSIKGKIVGDERVEEGFLTVGDDGKILGVEATPSTGGSVLDTGGCYIVPGFIDLHTHGIHDYLADNGPDDLAEICRILPRYGVTGFLPTLAPRPAGEDALFLRSLADAKNLEEGSRILGFHLEGPFLKITGSLTAEAVSAADGRRVEALIRAALPYRVVFSVSPDVEGIEELIPSMVAGGAPVFMTHTAATVRQTQRAIELGARHATHFYDVFPCPAVSEPGVRPCGAVEAILADPRVSVDFILDGVHVDPVAVKMALACKSQGPGRVCLITDSNVGAGMEPGRFTFGGSGEIYFEAKGAPARLVKDGTLAGSGLTMDRAFRNAVEMLGVTLPQAARMVGTNPAEALGVGDRKGRLMAGYDADLVILDDRLDVVQTYIGGICRYNDN